MQPFSPIFGGGATESLIHPLVFGLMLLAGVLFLVLGRKYVVVPFVLAIILIPVGQQFYVGGVHLFVSRILILAALFRVLASRVPNQRSRFAGGWNSIDTAFAGYVLISAIATLMRYPSGMALINQMGFLWDYLLGYLVMRSLLQDERDTVLAIKWLAAIMVLLAVGMVAEQMRMGNFFGLLGGVASVPEIRNGKIRSQAVFQHALTAGAFAATSIPLLLALWIRGKARFLAALGIIGAMVMTVATQTSTSLLTLAAAIVGVLIWPLRARMKVVTAGLAAFIVGLHLVMKAPVWFLIARIDLTGSSSSYHRAELVDQFVNNFGKWWLIGTKEAATWGWDMWDAQNMFVSVGEAGGLAALICYILVISRSFARLGVAGKRCSSSQRRWLLWLLGAALFANVIAFFGVNYFDQLRMAWFMLISMICACTAPLVRRAPAPARVPSSFVMDGVAESQAVFDPPEAIVAVANVRG